MNQQRALAIIFTSLMLASSVPAADATHISSAVPDVPTLPYVRPTQDCTATSIEPQVLARANQLVTGDPAFFQNDVGAPAICLNGVPIGEWQDTVTKLDSILNDVRNASHIIQRQVDQRTDATLPESLPGQPLQLVEPRTVLLNDSFDGHRNTGFGDWKTITQRGDASNWLTSSVETLNGTRTTYRFGDDSGYARGTHEWLVSPEIDLTALQGQKLAVEDLTKIRQLAHDEVFVLCERGANPLPPLGCDETQIPTVDLSQTGGPDVGAPIDNLGIVYRAYEMAIDSTIYQLPVMQHSAYVDLTYRMNFPAGVEGVRLWLYVGDRQPDRTTLFANDFGKDASTFTCPTDPTIGVLGSTNSQTVNTSVGSGSGFQNIAGECTESHHGGVVMGLDQSTLLKGMRKTSVFGTSANAVAFSGEISDFVTQRLNLTPYMGERVWILFEAQTKPNDRGIDIFHEVSFFPHPKDFGFELARVYAEGDGYLRNFRLKDIGVTYPYATRDNTFGDDANTTRTTSSTGNDDIAVWLHNAGDYYENATFTLNASRSRAAGLATNTFGTAMTPYTQRVSLAPDEVKTLHVQWSKVLEGNQPQDGYLYELQGALLVDQIGVAALTTNATGGVSTDTSNETPDRTPHLLDPNITQVRPANAAGTIPGAGDITLTRFVRAAKILNLTALRADQQPGEGLQFCSAITGTTCTEQWVGPKGQTRLALIAIRNDGNAAQDVTVDLSAKLDGVERPDIITDGAQRLLPDMLPGEVRVVNWTLTPTQPGAYDVGVAIIRGDGTPNSFTERRLFVQRSTGLICLDTLVERECGPTLAGGLERTLAAQDITASTIGPDGTLYVATHNSEPAPDTGIETGLLAARDPTTGQWRVLANLSADHLNRTLADRQDGDRAWGTIRSITAAPDSTLWLVGDNLTVLSVPVNGDVHDHLAPDWVAHADLTTSLWHNGTLLAAGTNGTLLRLDDQNLTQVNLTVHEYNESGASDQLSRYNDTTIVVNVSALKAEVPYTITKTIESLVHAPNGDAFLLGEQGLVLRNRVGSNDWSEVTVRGDLLQFAVNGTPMRAAASAYGRMVLVGGETILVNRTGDMSSFVPIAPPAPLQNLSDPSPWYLTTNGTDVFAHNELTELTDVVPAGDGRLAVLDYEGRVFTCTECFSDVPQWEHPEPELPTVITNGPSHPARVSQMLSDGASTYFLGEAGLVMTIQNKATYADDLDWTSVPALAPHDGGVIATPRAESGDSPVSQVQQIFLAQPLADGEAVANAATRFRLFLNHSVVNASRFAPEDIRLVYQDVPTVVLKNQQSQGNASTNPVLCQPQSLTSTQTAAVDTVCNSKQVRYEVAAFLDRSPNDGWNAEVYNDLPSAAQAVDTSAAGQTPAGRPAGIPNFFGIEFYSSPGTEWAIDDLHLQGCLADNGGNCGNGQGWQDVLEWRGPSRNNGTFYAATVYDDATHAQSIAPVPLIDPIAKSVIDLANANLDSVLAKTPLTQRHVVPNLPTSVDGAVRTGVGIVEPSPFKGWAIETSTPFAVTTVSPWHVTTGYADSPVFAANNENYLTPKLSGGSAPRLLSNWDTRLVSPVIDLRDAFDPAITFRQSYAFRTEYVKDSSTGKLDVYAGDGGIVELQYLLQGAECGKTDPTATCGWSPFYVISPDGGYPGTIPLNLQGYTTHSGQGSFIANERTRVGDNRSFWGRTATPDATGQITDPRVVDRYQPVTITLANVRCPASVTQWLPGDDCVPTNLSGRQIRLAFHLYTAGNWLHDPTTGSYQGDSIYNATTLEPGSLKSAPYPTTLPGEGWYVTDFKVLGSRQLGIDLTATHMTFRVGYDVANIGVGPGTRVPINVTVENHGMFDALGYTGKIEVRRILDPALQTTVLVDTINLPQQPLLAAGKSANHTMFWNVPTYERGNYTLTFTLTPIGIDRDEDPLDNVAHIGTMTLPVVGQTVRRFNAEFFVSPQNATIDITRYIPMYINNTGNVPVDHLAIERRITMIGASVDHEASTCDEWRAFVAASQQTAIVDCRDWTSQRAAPPGALTPITQLSDDVSPTADLFWKAPERASYLVSMGATTVVNGQTLASGVDQRVSAFATYLFDDVEGGPRGESERGQWVFGPGWNVTQPGFRSTDSYAFGDPLADQYPANANSSLVSPVIDLGNARTAGIAFYHRYKFEDGFDGGIIEASADGGQTWTPINTTGDSLSTAGYNKSLPIEPSSPIHPNGDPDTPAYGFTGDSSLHPASVDSWVLSQVDLTSYANVTEPDVSYESYGSTEIQNYGNETGDIVRAPNVRSGSGWCRDSEPFRCWEVQNVTEHSLTPPTGDGAMWWSGSPSIQDDGKRPIENQLLEFNLDFANIQKDQQVTADWWEYGDRFDQGAFYLHNDPGQPAGHEMPAYLRSVFMFESGTTVTDSARYNLGKPSIVETRGKWFHMVSDITDLVHEEQSLGYTNMTLGFAYTPVDKYASVLTDGTSITPDDLEKATNGSFADRSGFGAGANGNQNGETYINSSGLAIDGFMINATRLVGGAAAGEVKHLLDPTSAWTNKQVSDCGIGWQKWDGTSGASGFNMWLDHNGIGIPCTYGNTGFVRLTPSIIQPSDDGANVGRVWSLVTELPSENATWSVVPVRDENGAAPDLPLPTGDFPKAWYSGEPAPSTDKAYAACGRLCAQPNSESRLVTPAIDLGKIAGDNAALSFWHRYAFFERNGSYEFPLASGGTVEIQVYDATTNTWSDWQQLYNGPIDLEHRGGYTGVTANRTQGPNGVVFGASPFHSLVVPNTTTPVQFLYTGKSTDAQPADAAASDGWKSGWIHERFDLGQQYLGKRVRIGFHVAFNGRWAADQGDARLDNVDGGKTTAATSDTDDHLKDDHGGWWISNLSVVGDVIEGKQVQLRMRAGSDGNVEQGSWQIDDLGVYGSRYHSNVGLFVDQTPGAFGAAAKSAAQLPITIRNFGTTVRRDLAVEVANANDVDLNFTSTDAPSVSYGAKLFRMTGITVGPGQSVTVNLTVRTPASWGDATSAKLLVNLKEFSPASAQQPYVLITDNEVQGLLSRTVSFGLQKQPTITATTQVIRATQPQVGQPVDIEYGWTNDGFAPATLNITCAAQTITGWNARDHRAVPTDLPVLSGTYDCTRVSGALTVPPHASVTTVYRATPTAAGFLQFRLTGNVVGGSPIDARLGGIAVGTDPTVYHDGFDDSSDVLTNWTHMTSAQWEYLRGVAKPGSLLLGTNDNNSANGYSCSPCAATSPIVDLHNFSAANPAFLSFSHMDRLARFDGARVVAQRLNDETKPGADDTSWSDVCVLVPSEGYEGFMRNIKVTPPGTGNPRGDPGDPNPLFGAQESPSPVEYSLNNTTTGLFGANRGNDFFISAGGVWEDTWKYESIDLSKPCVDIVATGNTAQHANLSLLGGAARFRFEVWGSGNTNLALKRGLGQGMFVDDVTVGPQALAVRPLAAQHATLLDNTTKSFHVVVTNLGSVADIVHLEYDAQNSSAPDNTISVTNEHVTLAPGESRILTATVTLPRDPSLLPTDFGVQVIARSDIDPNVAVPTRLALAFAPRPWPELAVSVDAPTGIVQEGTETFIPITIENSGLTDSVNTTVRITDTWNGGNTTTDLPLSSMPSYTQSPDGSTRVLEFRWRPEKGSVGAHSLRFEVDPDHLGQEYTRANNLVALSLSVSDLLIPDLYVSNFSALSLRNAAGGVVSPAFDADVARYEVTAGELVSFDLTVKNIGRAGATNVDVRAFIGALSLPPKTIPYIGPGSEVVVTFNWLAQKGEHNVEFLVRSEQVELSTANNRYPGTGVSILTVKGYEVGVDIPDLAGILEPGQAIDVPFSIHNAGNAGEDLVLVAHAPQGSHLQLPKDGFFLRAGETYTDKARLLLDDEAVAGEQFLSIDAIARENPMKVASGRAALRVNASYGGSVAGGLAAGSPPGFVLPIELTNEGNSLEPWNVTVRLPAGWTTQEKLPASISVPAHGRTTLSLHLGVPASTTPGDRVLQVRAVLPDGTRRDGLVTTTVLPLRAAAVTVASAAPKPEKGALTIPVTVENKGNVQQPFTVLLTDKPSGVDIKVEPAVFDLPPGGKAVAQLIVKPNASIEAGTYAVTGYTLFQGVAPQTAEGRANIQSLKVPIQRQDLRLAPLEYSPRAGLAVGDHVSVKVSVSNRGLSEVTDVPVHLFVDDVFIAESIVHSLPAGGRADVTFNWTAINGPHTLTAVVDPYQDTVEADRANTAVSALATVGTSAAPGGVAAGKANTPMPGAGAIIVVALAAALLMGAARRQRR